MVLSVRTSFAVSYRVRPQLPGSELSDRTNTEWLWGEIPGLVEDVIAGVQSAVPEYREVAADAEDGIRQALEGFVDRASGRTPVRTPVREVSLQFGRGEAR